MHKILCLIPLLLMLIHSLVFAKDNQQYELVNIILKQIAFEGVLRQFYLKIILKNIHIKSNTRQIIPPALWLRNSTIR